MPSQPFLWSTTADLVRELDPGSMQYGRTQAFRDSADARQELDRILERIGRRALDKFGSKTATTKERDWRTKHIESDILHHPDFQAAFDLFQDGERNQLLAFLREKVSGRKRQFKKQQAAEGADNGAPPVPQRRTKSRAPPVPQRRPKSHAPARIREDEDVDMDADSHHDDTDGQDDGAGDDRPLAAGGPGKRRRASSADGDDLPRPDGFRTDGPRRSKKPRETPLSEDVGHAPTVLASIEGPRSVSLTVRLISPTALLPITCTTVLSRPADFPTLLANLRRKRAVQQLLPPDAPPYMVVTSTGARGSLMSCNDQDDLEAIDRDFFATNMTASPTLWILTVVSSDDVDEAALITAFEQRVRGLATAPPAPAPLRATFASPVPFRPSPALSRRVTPDGLDRRGGATLPPMPAPAASRPIKKEGDVEEVRQEVAEEVVGGDRKIQPDIQGDQADDANGPSHADKPVECVAPSANSAIDGLIDFFNREAAGGDSAGASAPGSARRGDDNNDDDDEEEDAIRNRIDAAVADLPACAKLNSDLIMAYCEFTGEDIKTWRPHDTTNQLGARDIYNYQALTAYWMLRSEGENGFTTAPAYYDNEDEGSTGEATVVVQYRSRHDTDPAHPASAGVYSTVDTQEGNIPADVSPSAAAAVPGAVFHPVGGTLGHRPGVGKTPSYLAAATGGILIGHNRAAVDDSRADDDDDSHLPADAPAGSKCPTADVQFARYGFRCLCEPANIHLYRAARLGHHVFVSPHSLLRQVGATIDKFVDAERIKKATGGYAIKVLVGHHQAAKLGHSKPDAATLGPHCYTAPTLAAYEQAYPDVGRAALAIAFSVHHNAAPARLSIEPLAPTPPRSPPNMQPVFIITTPGSFSTQVMPAAMGPPGPALRETVPCAGADDCDFPGRNRHAANHMREFDGGRRRLLLPIARIFDDEAHLDVRGQQKGSVFRDALDGTHTNTKTTLWTVTGTPMTARATGLLPLFRLQDEADGTWRRVDHLRALARSPPSPAHDLVALEALLRECDTKKTISATKFRGVMGHPKPVDEERALEELTTAFTQAIRGPLASFVEDFMIQMKSEDSFGGAPLVSLPAHRNLQLSLALPPQPLSILKRVLERVNSERSELLSAKHGITRNLADADYQQLLQGWRYLKCVNCVPAIDEQEQVKGNKFSTLFAKNLRTSGWWERPEECVLWDVVPQLIASSPKLQHLLGEIRARSKRTDKIVVTDENLEEQTIPVKRRTPLVIACDEIALLFVVFLCISHELSDRRRKMVGVLRSGVDNADIVRRFQLQVNPHNGGWADSQALDLLLMSTRVGATGFTLTSAAKIIAFDVDPDPVRADQIPARISRVGQQEETEVLQLIGKDYGIEELVLYCRRQGAQSADVLLAVANHAAAGGTVAQPLAAGASAAAAIKI